MYHSFDIDLATRYGVDEAILLYNLIFWLRKNKANDRNIHDGRAWTYNSANSLTEMFPFWNSRKIARLFLSLEEHDIIISSNYNKAPYDRTKWYALIDETLLDLPLDNMSNGLDKSANGATQSVQPIPDQKTDQKPDKESDDGFDDFWMAYDRKSGKESAQRFWKKLSKQNRSAVMQAVPAYVASTPDKQFRMAPATYINPANKRWEDEIIDRNESKHNSTSRRVESASV